MKAFLVVSLIFLVAAVFQPLELQAQLNPPTDLVATVGDGYVDLGWLAPVAGVELAYDDGVGEGNLSIGATGDGDLAVRFTPNVYPTTLLQIKVFFAGASAPAMNHIDWTIWDGSSTGPVTSLATGTQAINRGGFDLVDISSSAIQITAGDFFISYHEPIDSTMNLEWDTTQPSADRSWVNAPAFGLPWQTLATTGISGFDNNLMIRAIVQEGVGANARLVELSPNSESRPLTAAEIKKLTMQRMAQGIAPTTGAVCIDGTRLPNVSGNDAVTIHHHAGSLRGIAGLQSYNIYRSEDGTNFSPIASVDSMTLNYTDNTANNGTAYWYYVTAVYDGGESGPSNVVTATPIGPITGFCDDFDSYTAGIQLATQTTAWTTWSNMPGSGEDPYVSDVYAYSPSNSVVIVQNNDLVKPTGGLTTGKWTISFQMYIPNGKAGYWNTLTIFNPPTYEWAMQAYFNVGGTGTLDAGGAGADTFNYAYDTWIPVKVVADLDNDVGEFWLDGVMEYTWQWTLGTFGTPVTKAVGGNDFFGATADDEMYIDDYCILSCTPGFLGDVNGDGLANSTDALILLSYDAGLPLPQPILDRIADGFGEVNGDGVTNSTDALIILSYDAGITVPFPVGDPVCLPAAAPAKSATNIGKTEKNIDAFLKTSSAIAKGSTIDVPVMVDMSKSSEKLGSYTVTLQWDPAQLQFQSYSGGTAEGFSNPVVNDAGVAEGKLIAAHAYPFGADGQVNILNLRFKVIGNVDAITNNEISMDFSAMAAAMTFNNLLPNLEAGAAEQATDAASEAFSVDNYPNPFNPTTTIGFSLPSSQIVNLTVYNVLGQQVATLISNKRMSAGAHRARFDASNLPSGIYYYHLRAGEFVTTQKMMLLK